MLLPCQHKVLPLNAGLQALVKGLVEVISAMTVANAALVQVDFTSVAIVVACQCYIPSARSVQFC